MKRLLPGLALVLAFFALAFGAQACRSFCDLLFGRQTTAPLTDCISRSSDDGGEVLLRVSIPPRIERTPSALPMGAVANSILPDPARSVRMHPWGTLEVERVFEFAYGPFLFDFGQRRRLLDRWIPTIGNRLQISNASTFEHWM